MEAARPHRVRASPLARRLAREHGLDLGAIRGSGPGGRIVKADVERALTAGRRAEPSVDGEAAGAADGRIVPLSRMRAVIAERMSESMRTAPHFYVTMAVTMDRALRLREELNRALGEGCVSINDLLLKASALALSEVPELNARWEDDAIRRFDTIDIAVAVALEDGLITPVVRDCGAKPLKQIAAEAAALIERARAGRLLPEQYRGGTFTVSNLGMMGVEAFSAIINPPQAAILAVGAAQPEVVARDKEITIETRMRLTLSADHRVADGAVAARFLQALRAALEDPVRLLV
ncbi:MAG TPA: dihydrolipoamide acetyltransferase family protein, partial [Limnochordia bacterium]